LTVASSHSLLYDWTGRNQLESIQDTTTNIRPTVYAYDPSGNIDSIVKSLGTAQISTNFDYNAVNGAPVLQPSSQAALAPSITSMTR